MRPLAGLARPQFGYPGSGDPPADPPPVGTPPQPGDPNDPRNTGFPPGGSGEHHFGGGGGGGPFRPPGPGFNPDDVDDRGMMKPVAEPSYIHSLATPALRKAGYDVGQANHLIRLARRGQLNQFQGPGGAYRDPTANNPYDPRAYYDPTPPVGQPYVPPTDTRGGYQPTPIDPVPGDTRRIQSTDPGYYGGFKTPETQQGLQAVAARWDARRARQQARRGR